MQALTSVVVIAWFQKLMTKRSFLLLDLSVLTLIAVVAECLDTYLFSLFGQVYALSIALAMGAIAIYRWNALGLAVPSLAGLSSVLVRYLLGQKVTSGLWLAYSVGYLAMAVCLLWFLKAGSKDLINKKLSLQAGYYFSGALAVEALRSLCQIGNGDFWAIALSYYAYDLLNVLFGFLLFVVACHQKGMVVDMNSYLTSMAHKPISAVDREEKDNPLKLEEMAEQDDVNDAALLDGGTLSAEDLAKMTAPKNKAEHKETVFDKENAAAKRYHDEKSSRK